MRKKFLVLALALCVACLTLAGCGGDLVEPEDLSPVDEQQSDNQSNDVDVDLTKLSDTMISSTVTNIYENYNDYIGKIIKITAPYAYYFDEETEILHHYAVFFDEASCCSYGFEFESPDYDGEYPEYEEEITITGELKSVVENGETRLYLQVNEGDLLL